MSEQTVKKSVKELINRTKYSKLMTFGPDGTPHGRIMTNLPLGDDMVIWYATGLSTNKAKEIETNPNVSVFVDDPDDQTNAFIIGKAEIVTDARLRRKYWQEMFSFFFPGGPSDSGYCLLKITPKKIEYSSPGPSFHPDLKRRAVKL